MMKKSIVPNIILAFCLAFTLTFDSCNKTDSSPVPSDILSIADFSTGTYWIYKCDSLNKYDTVSVSDYTDNPYTDRDKNTITEYSDIYINLYSTFYHATYSDHLSALNSLLSRTYKYQGQPSHAAYSINTCDNIFCPNDGLIKILYHYNLSGTSFDTVFMFTSVDLKNKYYFARNYGIIKREIADSLHIVSWHMVDHSFVRPSDQ